MNASAIQKTCNSIISHSERTPSSASIAYTYTDDRLTFVSVNDTTEYTLTYDEFGRSLATVAGSAWRGTSTTLSTNAYDEYGKLDRTTYGNGFVVSYVYDSLDRVIAVKFNDTVAYRYTYNGEGDLYSAQDVALGYTIYYEYDHAGRCMASTTKSDSTGAVLASYSYEYDLNNNLSKLTCTTNGTTWATTYTYDGDNRPTATTLANGKTVTNTYDALGRITRKRIGLSSNYDTTFTYLAGANNSQTALLASYQNGSDTAYTYTYDENGNITSISQGGSTTYYTYDRLNELIREDNATLNQSWTYTYDVNGNLLNKKRYAYVPNGGTLGACLETISYGYDAAHQDWADQLTSYNGETIRYDDSGNPISYRGYTMAWQGKRLTSANKSGTAITYSYDENGIRTQKTVNGVTTNYYYNGSVLMSLTQGDTSLLFSYDAAGNVVAVEVQSDSWYIDGQTLYYIRNGQGDITGLIESSGRAVIEYRYDTWGKDCSYQPEYQEYLELQELNPFRYRGYVYDTETGLYYVSSRYYDPEIGRFINADGAYDTNQGVLGYNMYAYCLNNPVNMYDPDGRCSRFLGFLWKKDCKQASCPESKNYVKPKAVDPIGSYNKGQGYVYIVKEDLLDEIMEDKEDNVVVVLDNRTASDPNMQIQDSYRITKTKQQNEIAQIMLDYNTSNPVEPAWSRTLDSLVEEWKLHNFAYSLGIKRERTADCDFNNADEGMGFGDFVGR